MKGAGSQAIVTTASAICSTPWRRQLDPFHDPSIGNIAASGRQGWLPRIDTKHPQRWPGSRCLDRKSSDARADIKERRGPTPRCRELWPLF